MLKFNEKIKSLSGIEFLSNIELLSIFLKALFVFIICVPFSSEIVRSIMMLLVFFMAFVQLIVFSYRSPNIEYPKKFKVYLIVVLLFLISFFSLAFYLSKGQLLNIYIEIAAICWVFFFFIIGLINFRMAAKYLFYWRLKRIFPFEGEKKNQTEFSLKKLSPHISLEKQKAYLIISFGTNIIIYGFYTYFCLLAFKLAKFTDIPVLEKVQSYLINWSFINSSNAIGLFSIVLALLTICVPAQQRIVREANQEVMERFKNH